MMIAVSIAGALVVYAWIMGYIGVSTERAGEAILIQSIANHEADLMVYVQNIGEGVAQLEEDTCLYVNGILVPCTISGGTVSDKLATLDKGETAMLRYSGGAVLPGVKTKVKVTTLRGTATEKYAYPSGSTCATPVLDHFSFTTIASPQTLGIPFSVTIRAMDQYADPFTGYSGTNTLTYSAGEISPTTTANFSDGVWTGTITLTGTATDATITTAAQADPNRNGISNTFNIEFAIIYSELNQYELLGGGARWAARDGETALYINWKDNWLNHSTTDGSDWWWKPSAETDYEISKNAVVQTLEDWGFQVTCASDMPETLNGYDLVVIEAYYAVEPKHANLVEEYIVDGGGVAILGGVPCYFSVYCKDMWPYRLGGMDLTPIQDWFGSSRYVNTGGIARTIVDNPVGTSLNADEIIVTTTSYSMAAITQLNSNAEVIGTWDRGTYVYSYTHEYGEGRVFYQGGPFWNVQ